MKQFKECGPIYEVDIYTNSNGDKYALAGSKDQPVHLWDLKEGKIVT